MTVRNVGRNSDRLKLKFPVIKNFIYFDIVKGKETLLSFSKKDLQEIEGKSWREFQFIVQDKLEAKYGQKYPAGRFNYICQQNNSTVIERGLIKTISRKSFLDAPIEKNEDQMSLTELQEIKKTLESLKSSDKSTDMMLTTVKQGYELQISFLNQQIQFKDSTIKQFEKDIEKLDNQLDKYESEIEELRSKTGFNQLLEIGQKMLVAKFGQGQEVTNLSASNTSDIPEEILQILGMVDYQKIPGEQLQKIISGLKQYISVLPLKGQS